MILIGKNKPDYIGELSKTHVLLVLLIGNKVTAMNFWVQNKDFVLLHSLIDVISLSLKLWVCFMVVHQQDLQEQEKLKQLRILVEDLVFLSSSQIVQINIDIKIWLRYLKD